MVLSENDPSTLCSVDAPYRIHSSPKPEPICAARGRAARDSELLEIARQRPLESQVQGVVELGARRDLRVRRASLAVRDQSMSHSTLPGFMMPCGSSAAFSVRISASAVGDS